MPHLTKWFKTYLQEQEPTPKISKYRSNLESSLYLSSKSIIYQKEYWNTGFSTPGTLTVGTADYTTFKNTFFSWGNEYDQTITISTADLTTASNTLVTSFQELGTTFEVAANSFATLNANWGYGALTEAQKEAAKVAAAKYAEQVKAREAAKVTAKELLISFLDESQKAQFLKDGTFVIVSELGNLYQIKTGRSHNVRQLDSVTMKPVMSLCAHPVADVPDYDTMLAQMFWLINDEKAFVKMANTSPLYGRNPVGPPDPIVVEGMNAIIDEILIPLAA